MACSSRRAIAVQADYTGIATHQASTVNEVLLGSGAALSQPEHDE